MNNGRKEAEDINAAKQFIVQRKGAFQNNIKCNLDSVLVWEFS